VRSPCSASRVSPDVIQRGMDRSEERTSLAPALRVAQTCGGSVKRMAAYNCWQNRSLLLLARMRSA
jgi:hypothetical protein